MLAILHLPPTCPRPILCCSLCSESPGSDFTLCPLVSSRIQPTGHFRGRLKHGRAQVPSCAAFPACPSAMPAPPETLFPPLFLQPLEGPPFLPVLVPGCLNFPSVLRKCPAHTSVAAPAFASCLNHPK